MAFVFCTNANLAAENVFKKKHSLQPKRFLQLFAMLQKVLTHIAWQGHVFTPPSPPPPTSRPPNHHHATCLDNGGKITWLKNKYRKKVVGEHKYFIVKHNLPPEFFG